MGHHCAVIACIPIFLQTVRNSCASHSSLHLRHLSEDLGETLLQGVEANSSLSTLFGPTDFFFFWISRLSQTRKQRPGVCAGDMSCMDWHPAAAELSAPGPHFEWQRPNHEPCSLTWISRQFRKPHRAHHPTSPGRRAGAGTGAEAGTGPQFLVM